MDLVYVGDIVVIIKLDVLKIGYIIIDFKCKIVYDIVKFFILVIYQVIELDNEKDEDKILMVLIKLNIEDFLFDI